MHQPVRVMYEVGVVRNPQFHRIFLLMEPQDTKTTQRQQGQAPQNRPPGVTTYCEAKPAIL